MKKQANIPIVSESDKIDTYREGTAAYMLDESGNLMVVMTLHPVSLLYDLFADERVTIESIGLVLTYKQD